MFSGQTKESLELRAIVDALDRSQAMIQFNLDGTIVSANENFLSVMGYRLEEIRGKHHSMFVEDKEKQSAGYREFWEALNRGEFRTAEYKRIGKGGKEVWIQATYNPIKDKDGKPFKVIKFAVDVTDRKLRDADAQGQIDAIGKAQAVIHFKLDGTIITANDIFLTVMGYALEEVRGKHHSMFVDEQEKNSPAYRQFWEALNRGESKSAQYRRIGKGGKEVWILASYNPILDLDGKPFKVVKFASDVTKKINMQKAVDTDLDLIGKAMTSSKV
jgi:methyl-accepting chemotaxis protein